MQSLKSFDQKLIANVISFTLQKRTIYSFKHDIQRVPVITVPKYLEASVKKHQEQLEHRIQDVYRRRASQGNRNVPVITCSRRPYLNHYHGQTYPKTTRGRVENIPLGALGWKRLKYRNDTIVFRPYANNPFFKEEKNDHEGINGEDITFESLHLTPGVVDALKSSGLEKPSRIQRDAIPAILGTHNVICSAETGSGKTLAYLAPLMHFVKRERERHPEHRPKKSDRSPQALIVVPSRELAEQVGTVARNLGKKCGVGVATMIGGASRHLHHTGYDIIVTTIGLVAEHHKKGIYDLKSIKQLVLDEADTLLDDSFSFNVIDLLQSLKFKEQHTIGGVQLILVSATMPREMKEVLGDFVDMDNFEMITTDSLHQVLPHVKQTFININKYDRDVMLLRLVKQNADREIPTIVFSNRTPMSNWAAHFLKQNKVDCEKLNKSLPDYKRLEVFERFQIGDLDILSATDLGSRGLDTVRARHIINMECPRFVADYIHRAGRTGRVGCKKACEVTTFCSFTPDFKLLEQLEYSLRTGNPLNNVNANIKKLYKEHHDDKMSRRQQQNGHNDGEN